MYVIQKFCVTLDTNYMAECPREPYLQRIAPLRPKLPRHTSRDQVHIQDQSALRQSSERKGINYGSIRTIGHILTWLGRRIEAAVSSAVEAGVHHGDDTDRAPKVSIHEPRSSLLLTGE
jgi:hypothetical protein